MNMREFKWAAERLAFQEEDRQNQQLILDLQKENWKLKVNAIVKILPPFNHLFNLCRNQSFSFM